MTNSMSNLTQGQRATKKRKRTVISCTECHRRKQKVVVSAWLELSLTTDETRSAIVNSHAAIASNVRKRTSVNMTA